MHLPTTCISFWAFCLILFNCSWLTEVYANDAPIVEITHGKLQGSQMISDKGTNFFAFRGIPFAKPPVKNLRFKPPKALEKWNGILDATEDGHICIQFDFMTRQLTGDEDCLYLNVYSPKLSPSAKLPVMVFIHGGGFFSGTGASNYYGPQRLLDKDIVLVTFNYRLGVFGFLSTEDKQSTGNYGMLDQVQALRWVKENILKFGGDPDQVTIFGESAGSASVLLHTISPMSKGLFHAGIAQSGSFLSSWSFKRNPLKYSHKLAKRMGCPTESTESLIKCLKRKPALDLVVQSTEQDMTNAHEMTEFLELGPVADKKYGGVGFLNDEPEKVAAQGKINNVPLMIGVTKDEGFLLYSMFRDPAPGGFDRFDVNRAFGVLSIFNSALGTEERRQKLSPAITKEYFSDMSNSRKKHIAFNELFSDIFMNYEVDKVAEYLSNHVPVYVYKLTYRGAQTNLMGTIDELPKDIKFVAHLDDIQYLFHSDYFPSNELVGDDERVADTILTLWTNFAKKRVPSLKGIGDGRESLSWPALKTDSYTYFDIAKEPKIVQGHLCAKKQFWDKLFNEITGKDEL